MHSRYQSTKCSIQSRSKSWTIEDEQCQKVGGGYAAVKLRFLLFLWVEPILYLRRPRVQPHETEGTLRDVEGLQD